MEGSVVHKQQPWMSLHPPYFCCAWKTPRNNSFLQSLKPKLILCFVVLRVSGSLVYSFKLPLRNYPWDISRLPLMGFYKKSIK